MLTPMNSNQWVEWYLREVGARSLFLAFLSSLRIKGGRYGQAFFNALPQEDQDKLRLTPFDTFYSDDPFDCYLAIENVLTKD